MQFSDAELDELREIHRDHYGYDITRDEAAEIGARLVHVLRLIRRPPPKPGTPLNEARDG